MLSNVSLMTCLLIILTFLMCTSAISGMNPGTGEKGTGKEVKTGVRKFLCAEHFIEAWQQCCGKRCRVERKRTIEDVKNDIFEPEHKANGFLNSVMSSRYSKRNVKRASFQTNAHEECCIEGCTIGEVTEYPCM